LRTRHQPKFLGTSQFERQMRVLLPHQRDWDMVLTSSILGKFMSSLSDIMNHVQPQAIWGKGWPQEWMSWHRPKIWPESTCVFQNGAACFVAGCILNLLSEVFKLIIFLAFLIIVRWFLMFLGTLRFHLSPCLSPVIEDPLVI
jgi:hypothetical protein